MEHFVERNISTNVDLARRMVLYICLHALDVTKMKQ